MGTTATTLQTADGIGYVWVLAIEGCPYLLTNGSTSAAVTAWSGTDWSTALGGLSVDGEWEQSIDPWKPIASRSSLQFSVMDSDGADTFAALVFKRDGAEESTLEAALAPAGTTLSVKEHAGFASSGSVYIGPENIAYTTKGTGGGYDTFTGLTRGKYSPFPADESTYFPRGHYGHQVGESIVTRKPRVTDEATTWIGRYCGLWMHRVVAGVLDTKAQAQCVYAGKIAGIADSSDGRTVIETDDIVSALNDTIVYGRQWNGKTAEDIFIPAGTIWYARERGANANNTSNPLTVVASGASGADEINEGSYTIGELLAAFNNWLQAEKTAARIDMTWTSKIVTELDDFRVEISAKYTSATTASGYRIFLKCNKRWVMRGLGFDDNQLKSDFDIGSVSGWYASDDAFAGSTTVTVTLTANASPSLYGSLSQLGEDGSSSMVIKLDGEVGTWWDQTSDIPAAIQALVPDYTDSTSWGLVRIGDVGVFLARHTATNELTVYDSRSLSAHFGFSPIAEATNALASEESLRVSQVAIVGGSFSDVMLQLFASVAGDGTNHATYDAYENGLGAGIPWDILGNNFVNSVSELDASNPAPLTLVIDKPTKLGEVISSDLLLRRAHLIWKDQGLRVVSWSTPTSSQALHSFTESNKATPAGVQDANRSTTDESVDTLVNVIKVEYGRSLVSGEYASSISIQDHASIDEYGEKAVTIKARNVYKEATENGEANVALLASGVGAWLPFFARPLKRVRRSIDVNLFEGVAPGDLCTISDNFARDPATGTRGMSGKPGIILSHRYDFKNGTGEVDLIVQDYDRVGVYAPAAGVASYTGSTATCNEHDYSESAEAVDASHFVAGEMVWMVETDPDDPTTPTAWSREISSVSGNDIVFTSALSSPAYDSSLTYKIISQKYSAAASTQAPDTYQADDADGLIEDTAQAYEYGALYSSGSFTLNTANVLAERCAASSGGTVIGYGDGAAYDVGHERAIANTINNLANRKTAISSPYISEEVVQAAGAAGWHLLKVMPIYLGNSTYPAGKTKRLYMSPFYKVNSGTKSIRVTLCRNAPYGSATNGASLYPPYSQVTWSTTSTTYVSGTSAGFSTDARDSRGMAFIIIEGEAGVTTRGLGACNLGGLESV